MYIKSRNFSLIYKLVIAIIGTIALIDQTCILQGYFRIGFLYKFTNISNLAVVLYMWAQVICILQNKRDACIPPAPVVKHLLTLAISVTCLVAHFMLDNGMVFKDGVFQSTMLAVHYIVPIGFVLDWLLFDKKGLMKFSEPPKWLVFPLVYLGYAFFMVLCVGVSMSDNSRWPYPFIDVDVKGPETVFITCIILVVVFLVLGYVYVLIDKALARKK